MTAAAQYIEVKANLADVEPIASFITLVAAADGDFRRLTPAEVQALPNCVVGGIAAVQGALADLARAGVVQETD